MAWISSGDGGGISFTVELVPMVALVSGLFDCVSASSAISSLLSWIPPYSLKFRRRAFPLANVLLPDRWKSENFAGLDIEWMFRTRECDECKISRINEHQNCFLWCLSISQRPLIPGFPAALSPMADVKDLVSLIDTRGLECLNEQTDHPIRNAVEDVSTHMDLYLFGCFFSYQFLYETKANALQRFLVSFKRL